MICRSLREVHEKADAGSECVSTSTIGIYNPDDWATASTWTSKGAEPQSHVAVYLPDVPNGIDVSRSCLAIRSINPEGRRSKGFVGNKLPGHSSDLSDNVAERVVVTSEVRKTDKASS